MTFSSKKKRIVPAEIFYSDEYPNELPNDDPTIKSKYQKPSNI